MKEFYELFILLITFLCVIRANDLITQEYLNQPKFTTKQTAHISPEIINELKDFENLIPAAIVDEIVAKHYVVDGNFRTALKYLRSQEFSQLQKQLLSVPEIIDILDFLHLTTVNATTRHMGATKIPTTASEKASLKEYNYATVAESDKSVDKMTTNRGTIISKPHAIAMENVNEALSNTKVPKRPQKLSHTKWHNNYNVVKDDAVDDDANANRIAVLSNEHQPLVGIVLLEDSEVKANVPNKGHHYQRQCHDNEQRYHAPLGTFTDFVEEILQHLPQSDYQNMIKDKCQNNVRFAEFYQALRNPELKSVIEQAKSTDNIMKIIQTLSSHDVDVNSLEPIAFKAISWGPNI